MVYYHLSLGALAQLVAHHNGIVGVRSSNLLCSTKKYAGIDTISAYFLAKNVKK